MVFNLIRVVFDILVIRFGFQVESELQRAVEAETARQRVELEERRAEVRRNMDAELEHFDSMQKRRLEEQKATMQADSEERKRAMLRALESERDLEEQRSKQQKEMLQMQFQNELSAFERNLRQQNEEAKAGMNRAMHHTAPVQQSTALNEADVVNPLIKALTDVTPLMNVQKQVEAQVAQMQL